MKILHQCLVPFQALVPGDVWGCPMCLQRWKCEYRRSGGKCVHRIAWWRWLYGLD